MARITIIIGLPGSGKTHLGHALSKQRGIPFYDDCATVQESWLAAVEWIKTGKDCILSDPKFCKAGTYGSLCQKLCSIMQGSTQFENIYFENDPDTCIENVKDRDNERKVSPEYIRRLSFQYNPTGVLMRSCYKKNY